jgi:hypothetical protein
MPDYFTGDYSVPATNPIHDWENWQFLNGAEDLFPDFLIERLFDDIAWLVNNDVTFNFIADSMVDENGFFYAPNESVTTAISDWNNHTNGFQTFEADLNIGLNFLSYGWDSYINNSIYSGIGGGGSGGSISEYTRVMGDWLQDIIF